MVVDLGDGDDGGEMMSFVGKRCVGLTLVRKTLLRNLVGRGKGRAREGGRDQGSALGGEQCLGLVMDGRFLMLSHDVGQM